MLQSRQVVVADDAVVADVPLLSEVAVVAHVPLVADVAVVVLVFCEKVDRCW